MENEKNLVSESSPAELIKQAVTGGADLTKLEKLLELQGRWDATQAKKAYHKAMSEFKANPPKIDKDKHVAYDTSKGKTSYNHASLANVCEKISSELSKYGLSASWTTQQNGNVIVTCKITHVQGHSEETTLSAAADTTGSKNSIQAIGSTISYLCRYTLLCLTGLATYDQDDDGQTSEAEYITDDQVIHLKNLMENRDVNMAKFLKYIEAEDLEHILVSNYSKALTVIGTQKKKGNK